MINDVFTQDALINSKFKIAKVTEPNLRKDIINTPVKIWSSGEGVFETKIADFFMVVGGAVSFHGILKGVNVAGSNRSGEAIVRFTNTETAETQDVKATIGTGSASFGFSGVINLSANTHYEISTQMTDIYAIESAEATELYFSFSVMDTADRYIVSKQKEE